MIFDCVTLTLTRPLTTAALALLMAADVAMKSFAGVGAAAESVAAAVVVVGLAVAVVAAVARESAYEAATFASWTAASLASSRPGLFRFRASCHAVCTAEVVLTSREPPLGIYTKEKKKKRKVVSNLRFQSGGKNNKGEELVEKTKKKFATI